MRGRATRATHGPSDRVRRVGVALGLTVTLAALGLAVAAPAGAQELSGGLPAPVTRVSADGLSVTDGARTLSVSQSVALDPAGTTITVAGSGYDTFKGIYVAFCLIPPTNQPPTPCGGGATVEGTTGASHWISSNPPSYGEGLAVPYGPGGSFVVTMTVSSVIGPNIDCQRVRCAVVTRNDHVRGSDRSQDLFLPVTFATAATAPVVEPLAPPPTEAPTTLAPPTSAPVDTLVPAETTTTEPEPATTTTEAADDVELAAAETSGGEAAGRGSAGWLVLVIVVVVVCGGGTFDFLRRRVAGGTS